MPKLEYDNIFESITDKKTARALATASDLLVDMDDAMAVLGYDKHLRVELVLAVRRLHFARYH